MRWTDIIRGTAPSAGLAVAGALVAVLLALVVEAVLILLVGKDPIEAYKFLFLGSFGSLHAITETLTKASPLILAGLGVAFAFQCGLFNIGAEGQIYIGALAATWVGLTFTSLPAVFLLPFVAIAAGLLGGFWGGITGFLKAKTGANEIITTIMLNYVAIHLVSYMVDKPLRESSGFFPQTDRIAAQAYLPPLIPGTRLHAGFLAGLILVLCTYVLLYYTTVGYEVRTVGSNQRAAEFGGISVSRSVTLAMTVSGGLAGLAGFGEVSGIHHRLLDGISPGYGFDAIAVALLGKAHPLGVIPAAIFFGALRVGGNMVQRSIGVPVAIIYSLQGLVILFILSTNYFMLQLGRLTRGRR
ncbi:MAG: ABC transporter permease [Nitrospinota bacterium]